MTRRSKASSDLKKKYKNTSVIILMKNITGGDELNILNGRLEVGNGSSLRDGHHEGAVKRLHDNLHCGNFWLLEI